MRAAQDKFLNGRNLLLVRAKQKAANSQPFNPFSSIFGN